MNWFTVSLERILSLKVICCLWIEKQNAYIRKWYQVPQYKISVFNAITTWFIQVQGEWNGEWPHEQSNAQSKYQSPFSFIPSVHERWTEINPCMQGLRQMYCESRVVSLKLSSGEIRHHIFLHYTSHENGFLWNKWCNIPISPNINEW